MNNLHRELAPISDAAWSQIEEETARTIKRYLAGRHVVDVQGPGGIALSAIGTGHLRNVAEPGEGILARQREVNALAEQGDARAEELLGTVYYYSNVVRESKVEAVKWYRDQGYAKAQHGLGYLYQKGIGVLRDVVTADMWLNLAVAAGESDAADERDELEKRMTPAQIAEAEKLAREWKPGRSQDNKMPHLREAEHSRAHDQSARARRHYWRPRLRCRNRTSLHSNAARQ